MNIIILQGRLTKEPEIRFTTTNNTKIASFTLAVNRNYVEETDFISCVAYSKTADIIEKYLHKGNLVTIHGSMQIRKWTDKENNNREKTEVVISEVYFNQSKGASEEKKEEKEEVVEEQVDFFAGDSDLPF